MRHDHGTELRNLRISVADWDFVDLRIDIPPMSHGSDAANPHTQYSNAVAVVNESGMTGVGATFSLGAGNDLICGAAQFMVSEFDGQLVGDLMDRPGGLQETLVNTRQIRWLSPNAGLPMMGAGLIVNTLLDVAAKRAGLPAWEFLARLKTEDLLSLISLRHLAPSVTAAQVGRFLEMSLPGVSDRCEELRSSGLPVYFTTWIGHSEEEITQQIRHEWRSRGIQTFKMKVGPDLDSDLRRLDAVHSSIPSDAQIAVDANQTLSFATASQWLRELSAREALWLEEPFAPDNVHLFAMLADVKRSEKLQCEIATGENCPNTHTAAALMGNGIDRFQPDPCRMFGVVDGITTAVIAKVRGCEYTPHAGGTGLDELAPHMQLFNLARVDVARNPRRSLTENVGFCSHFYSQPTRVTNGLAETPTQPGLLVGYAPQVDHRIKSFQEGITWLEL